MHSHSAASVLSVHPALILSLAFPWRGDCLPLLSQAKFMETALKLQQPSATTKKALSRYLIDSQILRAAGTAVASINTLFLSDLLETNCASST